MIKDFMKEPYELIEARLILSDLALELMKITKAKWQNHEEAREILEKEEDIIRQVNEASQRLRDIIDKIKKD